jgi:hypothetical protein
MISFSWLIHHFFPKILSEVASLHARTYRERYGRRDSSFHGVGGVGEGT